MMKLVVDVNAHINTTITDNKLLIYKDENKRFCISPIIFDNEVLEKLSQYNVIELDDKYSDCMSTDFNEDLTFNVEKYNARKQKQKDLARITEIKPRLNQLSQDLIQAQAGAVFENLEEIKAEFQTLHNELRVLEGKEPRKYFS